MAVRTRAIFERVVDAFTENLAYKGLSLGFAIAIWAWVQSSLVVEARSRTRVNIIWPKGLVPASPVPDSLLATVEGPQGLIRTIDHYDPHIQVDLGDAPEGSTTLDFTASAVEGLPDGVRVTHLSPPGVTTTLEPRRSRKLEVRAAVEGDPAHGWEVKGLHVTPAFVVASGPESMTHTMTSVPTETVDVSGIKQDLATEVALAPLGNNITLSWTTNARVEVDVEPVVVSRTFTEVPVSVDGGTTDPTTVMVVVEGHQDEIEALQSDSIQAHVSRLAPGASTAHWGTQEKEAGTLVILVPDTAPNVAVTSVKPATVRISGTRP